jgi:hypothetical protein
MLENVPTHLAEVTRCCNEAVQHARELEPQIQALFTECEASSLSAQRSLALLAKAQELEVPVLALQEQLCALRSELPATPLIAKALLDPIDNAQAGVLFLQEGLSELRIKALEGFMRPRDEWDPYRRLGATDGARR